MTDEIAYRVPFTIASDGREVEIRNDSSSCLPWVEVAILGGAVMTPIAPGRLDAGAVVVARMGRDASRRGRLQLTWLRADGQGPFVWQSGL